MKFKEYTNLIKKKSWIVIISMLLFMVSSGLISTFVLTPVYEANTTLIVDVNNSPQDTGYITGDQLSSTQKLTVVYGEIIKSRVVLDKVINELNLDISTSQISDSITIAPIKDTQMMKVSVTNTDPKIAKDIANKIPIVFKQEVQRIMKANDVQVIDTALEPTDPIKPNKAVNISIAGILGLAMGTMGVLGKEYINSKIKTPKDIENNLGLSVLGTVPDETKLKSSKMPTSIIDEAYRLIRTNIRFSKTNTDIKSILVTSAQQDEGKTSVTTRMAKSFAKIDNKKVLIIDADMRNPSIYKVFNMDNSSGLSDVLLNKKEVSECIKPSGIKQLDVLVAGEVVYNPSELLSLDSMKDLVENLKKEYDYVFIDSPPVGIVADAGLIANYADATILVVGSNEVETDLCKLSKERLEHVGSNLIGCVLNKFISDELGNYSYEYLKK